MSQKVAPAPGKGLTAAETQAFLAWLRGEAADAVFHAGLKRHVPPARR